jgi:ADP-heptose:LPS heptosyltransferase
MPNSKLSPKNIAFIIPTLALGDFLCFSPSFIYALEQGIFVDVICEKRSFGNLDSIIFFKEKRFDAIRLLPSLDKNRSYDAVFLMDRKGIIPSLSFAKNSKLKSVCTTPIQSKRMLDLFAFNFLIVPLFSLFGTKCSKLKSNDSTPIYSHTFDSLKSLFPSQMSFIDAISNLVSRINSVSTSSQFQVPKSPYALIHIFRDLDFKTLSDSSLYTIAKFLSENYKQTQFLLLCNLENPQERSMLLKFENHLKSFNLNFRILPKSSYLDIVKIASNSQFYLGLDHGISHLCSLFSKKSILLYGATLKRPYIDRLWPPMVFGETTDVSHCIRLLGNSTSSVSIIHPSVADYSSADEKDPSFLLNKNLNMDNLILAFK